MGIVRPRVVVDLVASACSTMLQAQPFSKWGGPATSVKVAMPDPIAKSGDTGQLIALRGLGAALKGSRGFLAFPGFRPESPRFTPPFFYRVTLGSDPLPGDHLVPGPNDDSIPADNVVG